MEARKYVWGGAIPLQIHLHESEVTTLPPPLPALVLVIFSFFVRKAKPIIIIIDDYYGFRFQILAPRIGYLPLLVPHIKPHFSSTLPPGVDTVWFDYKGLPLKWYLS